MEKNFKYKTDNFDSDSKVIIVGNSPNVLKHQNGKWIDDFDVVIRINRCVTKGFEKFIGGKTDIWATVKAYGLQPRNEGFEPFVPDNFSSIKEIWHRTGLCREKLVLPKNKAIHRTMWKNRSFKQNFGQYTDLEQRKPGHEDLNMKSGEVFDNGLITILCSTLLYKNITVYGFSFYTESDGEVSAYYRHKELDENDKHYEDDAWERQKTNGFLSDNATRDRIEIIKDLEDKGLITIHEVNSFVSKTKIKPKKVEVKEEPVEINPIKLTEIYKQKKRISKSVIIVGNSPSILLQNYGDIIDNFNIVIRVNRCVTEGFEKKIGKRIDIWSTTKMNTSGNFYPQNYKTIQCLWTRSNAANVKDGKWLPKDFPKEPRSNRFIMFKHQPKWKKDFNHFLKPFGLTKEPCTGLLTILTACRYFDDITVHGFTFGNQAEDDLRIAAYYRNSELDEKGKHAEDKLWLADRNLKWASKEETRKRRDILRELVKNGIPNYHEPIKILNESELQDMDMVVT